MTVTLFEAIDILNKDDTFCGLISPMKEIAGRRATAQR